MQENASTPSYSRWLSVCAAGLAGWACCVAPGVASTLVRFDTTLGDIDVRLFDTATPISVTNFLSYVTDNDYDDSFFHRAPRTFRSNSQGQLVDAAGDPLPLDGSGRPILDDAVVDTFVVQGGGFTFDATQGLGSVPTEDQILNEPGLTNLPGTIAYAKQGGNPNSATSGFFFNTTNNVQNLDNQNGGFTVFARVVRGQETLEAITGLGVFDLDPPADPTPTNPFPPNPPTFDDVPLVFPTPDDQGLVDNLVFINDVNVLDLPEGDYDFDGDVDVDDYEVWRSQFGNSLWIVDHNGATPGTLVDADGNGDGLVSAADFTIWRDAFLAAGPATATVAPEPAAAIMTAILGGVFACRRRG